MVTRREFVKKGSLYMAGMGSSFVFPVELLQTLRKTIAPNDRIQVGLIGCNGMGFANLLSLLKRSEVEVVALCDVDRRVLDRQSAELQKGGLKKPKWYSDYRELLGDKDVDLVVIGTPDHWHCLQLTDALDAGKDVYCEKPLANSIAECQVMLAKAQGSDRIVQIGQWQRSQPHFVDAINYLHSGKLGTIRLVKTWAYQGWMKPVPVLPDAAAPQGVDYTMWLGPAPMRPFNENRFHFNFRWFWDYAGGLMTDWGVHLIDFALYGMKASMPRSVMAMGGKFAYPNDASQTPDTLQALYEFDGFSLLWEQATGIDGGNYGRNHGIAFVGNNGTLVLDRGGWEVIPEHDRPHWDRDLGPKIEAVPLRGAEGNGLDLHTANFLEAVKNRDASLLNAPLKVGHDVAMVCHMGNIAHKCGQRLSWDADNGRFNQEKADALLANEYNNGWKFPGS